MSVCVCRSWKQLTCTVGVRVCPSWTMSDCVHAQKLKAVDLYCGCGGMSFMDHRNDDVHIETHWAVDSHRAMCCSFEVNYPSAKVGSN